MYLRAVHADATIVALRRLIRDNPLGVLTTAIQSDQYPLIQSSHIPFVLDVEDESSETELGILRGHLARANPQSKVMAESLKAIGSATNNVLEGEVQVLFTSPVHHYVTPKFYTSTKPDTGKVVPTWNYAAAQVYGKARVYFDPDSVESGEFLAKQVNDLSQYAEENLMGYDGGNGRPGAWKVSDAPEKYTALLRKAIIGIEIRIERLEGKFKMSQEMGLGDRDGVIKGFRSLGTSVGDDVAELVEQRGALKDRKAE
ncbi:negative transcriptional regulator [Polychaeton citri CBS 116435]|uniref:Negative transcriptional regulator n=1 Tax=Polychaeton citri CBS 116435 TaxID=1314669 RepID=A0A9P4Q6J1_9PEZI|nr:negative transcriptional regulator [Polychaeton citri CBS 116435]